MMMIIPRIVLVLVSLSFYIVESREYKRVCYYTNSPKYVYYNVQKFLISDVDPFLCTHIIFDYCLLWGNKVQAGQDKDYELYVRLNNLKRHNSSLKTLLALYGRSKFYSQMSSTKDSRAEFISSAIQYLRKYNFDGLDINWQYPGDLGGKPEDKVNIGLLVKELKEAFDAESHTSGFVCLILTAAVAPKKDTIETAYDIPTFSKYVDFINIMSYDLHEYHFRPSTTEHYSPLFPKSTENGDRRYLNIDYAAKYWNSSGAPKEKIIIGLAVYGVLFRLTGNQTGIGTAGRRNRYMSYNEICALQDIGKGHIVYDSEQMVPYYTDGSLWVSFDDEVSLAMKIEWLVSEGYGGAMVWALHLDDVNQTCSRSNRKYPLLNTIKDGLVIAENGGTLTTPSLPTGMSSAVPTPSDPTTQDVSSESTQGIYNLTTQERTSSGLPCTDKISGIYADSANCSKFYNCEGVAFHINCPINLIYNSNRKYCDYHSNLVCVTQADVSTKAISTFPPSSSSVLPISTSSYFTSPEISSDLTSTSSTSSIQKSPSTSSFVPSSSFLPTQSSTVTSTSKPPSSSQNPRFTSVMTGTLPTITRTTTSHVSSIITSLRTTAALPSTTQSIPLTSVRTPVTTSITSTLTTPTSTSSTESPSIVPPQTTIHTSAQPLVTPEPVPLDFCVGKAVGHYPHPEDCSKYITCIGIKKYIRNCPAEY